jgi:hypothetical protein
MRSSTAKIGATMKQPQSEAIIYAVNHRLSCFGAYLDFTQVSNMDILYAEGFQARQERDRTFCGSFKDWPLVLPPSSSTCTLGFSW